MQVYGTKAVSRKCVQTLPRHEGNNWGWATFGSAVDKQKTRHDRAHRSSKIERVQQMLAQDRRVTLRLMAEELGISKNTVHTIVREDLGKRKICYRFVPHNLTRTCDSGSAIDSLRGLCWQFPEALWTLPKVCCEEWRLFWRSINLICLYLLLCLFSDTIHRTF